VVSDENLRKLACCKSLVQFSDIMTAIYGGPEIFVPIYSG
jgi:hypothetical protein